MFESYYKLDANPFRLSADERFRFAHKKYLKAWSYLNYALEQGEGFIMVTGRPGCGKTTLIRDMLAQMDKSQILAINLVTNQLQAEELLRKVALEFGLKAESYNKATLLTRIQAFVSKAYEAGKRAVIVIDEAQNLTLNGLEELRLLSNLQTGSHPLFQVFLVGQDELRSLILSPGMEQVRQRLIASCQVDAMDLPQTQGYIEHRLGIVGWNQDPVFDEVIFPLIHHLSGGIPRKINHIVSRLLLYGALEKKHEFTEEDVWIVARELFDEERLTLESGDSFTTFKEKYERTEGAHGVSEVSDSMAEDKGVTPVRLDDEVGITNPDTDLIEDRQDDTGLTAEPEPGEAAAEMEDAEEIGKEITETESVSEFYPYGNRLSDSDEAPADEGSNDETVRLTSRGTDKAIPAVPKKSHFDESELDVLRSLTSKVIGDGEVILAEAPTEARESSPEEILNLPSMQAERRKHEIDEKGGLINTAETFEIDDLLAGTLGRSIRNILLIVLAGIFLLLLVFNPARIEQLWEGAVAKLQSLFSHEEVGYQEVPPSTDVQLQVPTESGSSEVDEPATTESQARMPIDVAPTQGGGVSMTDGQVQIPVGIEEPTQIDGIETIEEPLAPLTAQPDRAREERVAALEEAPVVGKEDSPEARMEEQSQDDTATSMETSPGLEGEIGLVERASKDYIVTQSKYQKVEIGAADGEPSQVIPGTRKFQVYFEFDNPNIPEQFKEMLNDLYIVLSLNKAASMTITGYTDASGDPVYNMNLSQERASAVSSYFIDRGISSDRILIEGRGPLPKSTVDKHEELETRFGNRRVEIVLHQTGG